VLIVTGLILLIIWGFLSAVAQGISGSAAALAVASLVGAIITAPLVALAAAVLYLELRRLHGEPPPPAT
jgi:hypothetical protein